MGHYVFRLPDMGEGLAEAEIGDWHVSVGSTVREDDPLVEMMTDKATVEIASPVSGIVVALHGAKGERRPIGSDLAVLEVEGSGDEAVSPVSEAHPETLPVLVSVPLAATQPADEAPLAAPATRRRAVELGIALRDVPGTGPGGSITPDDLRLYAERHANLGAVAKPGIARRTAVEDVPVIGLRRVIAERLQDTKRRIPHFSYIEEVDMTALEALRNTLNVRYAGQQTKLTVLPFLIRALAVTLPDFPMMNALFDDTACVVHRHAAVHVGIATQTASGLVVIVLRHAEALTLWETATELSRLADLARAGKANMAEMTGSTITITSLGALGGLATTPIIHAPEVGIIGVNKMTDRPMARDGQVVIRKMMNLSSSFDHRVVDGWDAASFIQAVRQRLELPATLFMELP